MPNPHDKCPPLVLGSRHLLLPMHERFVCVVKCASQLHILPDPDIFAFDIGSHFATPRWSSRFGSHRVLEICDGAEHESTGHESLHAGEFDRGSERERRAPGPLHEEPADLPGHCGEVLSICSRSSSPGGSFGSCNAGDGVRGQHKLTRATATGRAAVT